MPLGTGNGTLTTSFQKIAEAGTPVTLTCTSAMILANDPAAASGEQSSWSANVPYPTDGTKDVYAKVASGTAPYQRTQS
ncbi:hypothetical protein GC170_14545 [bacterium]|nr:hypothetical protein [bacterium]